MSRSPLLRLALPILLAGILPSTAAIAQSQNSQSVAEAARRAREQKKAAAKPAKVFTDDEVKPATPADATSAQSPAAAGAGAANSPAAPAASDPAASGPKDEKTSKEIAALKEQIKQALSELDLVQREQALQQDTYFSNPDYVHDSSGKAKLDGMKQNVTDKQQELDHLKALLAELGVTPDKSAAPPPKP